MNPTPTNTAPQPDDLHADVIVVGGGSAGAVLAARLSEDLNLHVLLIEAGRSGRHPLFLVPGAQVFVRDWSKHAWIYAVEPDPSRRDRSDEWRRGKSLGGSSTINGVIFARGQPSDFDRWAALGLPEWSWAAVRGSFKQLETSAEFAAHAARGANGPTPVLRYATPHPLASALLQSFASLGVPVIDDINALDGVGVGLVQSNQRRGVRASTETTHLRPARRRTNLQVLTDATVHHTLFEGSRATGVAFERGGVIQRAWARREVVLCAGPFASPMLLMRSGIGPVDAIRAHGIAVRVDSPDVGAHLQDHPDIYLEYEVDMPTYSSLLQGMNRIGVGLQWLLNGTGPAASPGTHVVGFLKTDAAEVSPDVLMFAGPWSRLEDASTFSGRRSIFSISPSLTRPRSRGRIDLRSPDPHDPPRIHANMLGDEDDVARLIAAVRLVDGAARAQPFAAHVRSRVSPTDLVHDAAVADWIRADASTCYHACGTCRMGLDVSSVVDSRLRVRGVHGLRVVDSSVFPEITSANLHAPTVMLAERAAVLMREDWTS